MSLSNEQLRSMRRTGRKIELVIIAGAGLIFGLLIFGIMLFMLFQDTQLARNGIVTQGIVTGQDIRSRTDANGNTFPDYYIGYQYDANGTTYYGEQEVNRQFYEQQIIGNAIEVYYNRANPNETTVDMSGNTDAKKAGLLISGGAALAGGLVLFFLTAPKNGNNSTQAAKSASPRKPTSTPSK